MSKTGDYSSRTYTPGTTGPVKSQPTIKVDSSGKTKEKQEMVSLNDKFVQLINKVKTLESEKKKLNTKLKILKKQEDYNGKVDELVKHLENQLKEQIESLRNDQDNLKEELFKNQDEVEDTKKRYENELHKRAELENEFVVIKKGVDEGHLDAVELALELEDLMGKLEFLRAGYDEELKELESQIQNENVIIRDTEKRSLDMVEIVKTIEAQYANMATRTRNEAEQWNQKKMDAMVSSAGQREQEVRDIRREISDLVRQIQRLNADLDSLKRKEDFLKRDIDAVREDGEENISRNREHITKLEDALRRTKQDLARQICEHQELLNLKLTLDIEIATYQKLLEGEELRMNHGHPHADVHLPSNLRPPEKPRAAEPTVVAETSPLPPDTTIITPIFPDSKKRLLIRVEVESGRVVSESSHYAE